MTIREDIDPQLSHATWYWDDDESGGTLEVYLPPRTTHGEIYIYAEFDIYDTFGTWLVKENGRVVAEGKVSYTKDQWVGGRSPQQIAEHIICHGAD